MPANITIAQDADKLHPNFTMGTISREAIDDLVEHIGGVASFLDLVKNFIETGDKAAIGKVVWSSKVDGLYVKHKDVLSGVFFKHTFGDHFHSVLDEMPLNMNADDVAEGLYEDIDPVTGPTENHFQIGRYICSEAVVSLIESYDVFTHQQNLNNHVMAFIENPVVIQEHKVYVSAALGKSLIDTFDGWNNFIDAIDNPPEIPDDGWWCTEEYRKLKLNSDKVMQTFSDHTDEVMKIMTESAVLQNYGNTYAYINLFVFSAYDAPSIEHAMNSGVDADEATKTMKAEVVGAVINEIAKKFMAATKAFKAQRNVSLIMSY